MGNARLALLLAVCLTAPVVAQADPSGTFHARIDALTPAQKEKMIGLSWRQGCPVPLDDLAAIHLNHYGYDNSVHEGVLVVHRRVAKEMVEAFGALFEAKFPIERIQPYEDFAIGEYAASNDTAAFYCRPAQDDPSVFSWHAYGLAIDINPMTNPYHDPRGWWPAGSDGERNRSALGLLTSDSEAVRIFMRHGWAWGGMYHPPDYMHFGKVTAGDESNPLERRVWAKQLDFAPD